MDRREAAPRKPENAKNLAVMKEIVYDLEKFLERVDKSKPIHYGWRLSFDYWSRLSVVFEVSGKAKDGDWAVVFLKKRELPEIDEVVDKFVNESLKEVEKKVGVKLEWGRWE